MDPKPSQTHGVAQAPGRPADEGLGQVSSAGCPMCDDPRNHCIRKTSRIQVVLGEWGPRASDAASGLHISVSAVVRMALARFFNDDDLKIALSDVVMPGCQGRLSVTMSASSARRLTARARAAGMTRGTYLDVLIGGQSPAPLPTDHAELRSALARSNDQLAVALADLNGWTRLAGKGGVELPADCSACMEGLVREVRAHLALAARLLAELKPPRSTP